MFGPGGAGGVAAELKVDQVIELIQFVRQALEESDFRFLEWVTETAFDMISKIMSLHIILGESINALVAMTERKIIRECRNLSIEQRVVKDECRRILLIPKIFSQLTPLAKSEILDRICITYVFEPYSIRFDDDELQSAACMKLLDSIKSEREFIEILRLMGGKGKKGDSNALISNWKRVFDHLLFQSPQKIRARKWLNDRVGVYYSSLE